MFAPVIIIVIICLSRSPVKLPPTKQLVKSHLRLVIWDLSKSGPKYIFLCFMTLYEKIPVAVHAGSKSEEA